MLPNPQQMNIFVIMRRNGIAARQQHVRYALHMIFLPLFSISNATEKV